MTRTSRRLLLPFILATLGCAGAHAAELDLSDCDVLIGKKANAAYKGWLKDNGKAADGGEREAIRLRAIEAHNRLACHEEAITGDEGWGVIMTSGDGTSETHLPPGIPNIRKQPAAWRTLNEAVKYGHQAGAFDVGQKGAAAELVVRYAADLPQFLEAAYEDAAAVYEHDCVLKRQFGRRDRDAGCTSARTARARLIPLVAPERRKALDASARQWAEQLPAAPKNR
jgi:hypothetical protein